MELKLLHISDLHLDAGLSPRFMGLPDHKRESMAAAARETLSAAAVAARERGAHALVIAGDLFHGQTPSAQALGYVISTLAGLDPMPVLIAPGNHDFLGPKSGYDPGFLRARGPHRWPGNVHIFDSDEFTDLTPPGLEQVRFIGRGVIRDDPDRVLARPLPTAADRFNVLVLHGSRIDALPPGKGVTAPFSDAELLGHGLDYAALGHYHSVSELRGPDRQVRAAYPGATAGRGMDEAGPKGGLWVEISGPPGGSRVEIEPVGLGAVTIRRLGVNITGCSDGEELERRVRARLGEPEPGADARTLLAVEFEGFHAPGLEPGLDAELFADRFFHAMFCWDRARPQWDLEKIAEGQTTEAAFVREMQLRLREAVPEERGAELRRALYYGLEALHGWDIEPRHEDME